MSDKANQLRWLDGFNVGIRNTVNVSHLLYVADTLLTPLYFVEHIDLKFFT